MSILTARGDERTDGARGPVDRWIATSRRHPALVAAAVTGWMLAVSLFYAYYVAAIGPGRIDPVFWFLTATWLLAGLAAGRLWVLLLAFLPALVTAALGTDPLVGSTDMPQWFYALTWCVVMCLPATLIGVIAHRCVARVRAA